VGHRQAENGVTEELETFVGLVDLVLRAVTPVREREREERSVVELVSERLDEFGPRIPVVQDSAPTCPNT
jgi:hypothetical protein